MLSLVSILIFGIFATSPVLGQIFSNNSYRSNPTLYRWQTIQYWNHNNAADPLNGKVHFGLDGYGTFQFYFYSLALGTPPFLAPLNTTADSFTSYKLEHNGSLSLRSYDHPSIITETSHADSVYSRLNLYKINDTAFGVRVFCYNSTDAVIKTTKLFETRLPQDYWALRILSNYTGNLQSFVTTRNAATWGKDVKIYALDGFYDPMTIWSNEFPESAVARVDPVSGHIAPEAFSHARDLALLTESTNYGLAVNAAYEEVRLAEPIMNYFYEKTYLAALNYTLNDNFNGSKVVAFHGRFRNPGLPRVKCATEILYKQGIAVIHPLGNDNWQLDDFNPYAFTVGAVCVGAVCPNSNFGASLHLWAPGIVYSFNGFGTSYSAAFTAAAAATYMSTHGALRKNPGLLYQHLRNSARSDVIASSVMQVTKSPMAGNRVLNLNLTTPIPTTIDSRINIDLYKFCESINITGNLSVSTVARSAMHKLVVDAQEAFNSRSNPFDVDGYLVFSNSYTTTPSSTTKTF